MWPLYLLFNKTFKAEEEKVLETEDSGFLGSFAGEKLSANGKCSVSVVPRSHFVEVSALRFRACPYVFLLILRFVIMLFVKFDNSRVKCLLSVVIQ